MIVDANFVLDTLVPERRRHRLAIRIVTKLRELGGQARVTAATVHEVVFALAAPVSRNGYARKRAQVRDDVEAALGESAFAVDDAEQLMSALELYEETRLDFHDCYLAALANEGEEALLSFDRGLGRVASIDPLVAGSC